MIKEISCHLPPTWYMPSFHTSFPPAATIAQVKVLVLAFVRSLMLLGVKLRFLKFMLFDIFILLVAVYWFAARYIVMLH